MGLVIAVIAVALYDYCVKCGIDFCHFFLSIGYICSSNIVLKMVETSAAGDRDNPRFLIENPRYCNLSG